MANTLNNIKDVGSVIATLAAGYLSDENHFLKNVDKEPASSFGQFNGYKVGDTINVNKPARFLVGTTADITSSIQDVVEEKTSLSLSNQWNVPIALTSKEIATKMDLTMWAERILKPMMITLGNKIEASVLNTVKNATFNSVGTAGSTVFDTDTMLAAREKLMVNLADGDFYALLNSKAMRSAANARKGYFNASEEIAKQYKRGTIATADGFTYLENNLLPTHTRGTATGSLTVTTTVSVEGQATINLTGTGSQTLKAGDVFTIAGVYAVHPVTKDTLPDLQQFVVTADNTASSGAYTSVAVSPAFYTSASNGLQTVSAFPTSTSAVTLVGSASTGYIQSMAFSPKAVRFASAPLPTHKESAEIVGQETVNDMTVRIVRQYNVLTDKLIMRADVLWGVSVVRPEWVCRVTA